MLKSLVLQQIVGSALRHTATAAGGWMLAQGVADEAAIQQMTGGAIAALGVLFSLREKQHR